MLHFEGLRRRIIKYYFTIIIITIALFEGLFIFYIQNYYYDSVKQSLANHAAYTKDTYTTIGNESSSFEYKVNNIIEKEKLRANSKYAVQIIDKDKNLIIDQYGFRTNEKVDYEDVDNALRDSSNLTPYTYRITDTNEHLMSISVPLKVNNVIEGVVRYTVTLNAIDKTIFKLVLGLILAGVFILLITISISLRFAETLI